LYAFSSLVYSRQPHARLPALSPPAFQALPTVANENMQASLAVKNAYTHYLHAASQFQTFLKQSLKVPNPMKDTSIATPEAA